MKLGGIYIGVGAKTTQLQTDLNKAKSMTVRAADKIEASLTKAFKGMAIAAAAASAAAIYSIQKIGRESIRLAIEQEAVEKRLSAVIKSTGMAAGYNLGQMKAMASAMQGVTTTGDEVVLSGMAMLSTFKLIRGEAFERTMMSALDLSEVMQQDLRSSIVMLGKALNDPVANLGALSRAGIQFTKDQKEMIKGMWEAGNITEAQNLLLIELESQFGGAAKAARDVFGGAIKANKNALGDLMEKIGDIIIKNEYFVDSLKNMEVWLKRAAEAVNEWSEAHKQDVIDFFINAKKAIKFLSDAVSTLWKLFSAIPKGVLEYFSNVAESSKQATTEVNKLSEAIKNIEPLPLTPWQEFIGLFDRWGKEIVDVFVFIKKFVGAVLGVMADTFASFIKLMVNELYYLNEAIGKALTLDFKGAKESLGQLGGKLNEWQAETVRSWNAYEKTIYDAWDTMISNMEARLLGAAIAPSSDGNIPSPGPVVGGDITGADAERQAALAGSYAYDEALLQGYYDVTEELRARELERELAFIEEKKIMWEELRAYDIEKAMEYDEALIEGTLATNEALLEQHKQYEDAKLEWTRRNHELTLAVTGNIFNSLMRMSQGHSKKIFEIMKAASIANAIVSTYAGAANALRDVPFPFNLVAAASVIAYGMAQVQQIRAQTFSSGGHGGGGGHGGDHGGGYISPTGEIPDIDESEKRGSLTINIQGDMIGDEAYLEMLAEKISEAVEDRDIRLISSRAKYADAVA